MNISNIENIENLTLFIPNPIQHISAFSDTFSANIQNYGPDTFAPLLSFFNSDGEVMIAVQVPSYEDKDELYKQISQIMNLYSATQASACLFASDVRMSTYETEDESSKSNAAVEALSITFMNEESSAVFTMPYRIENNTVVWLEDKFVVSDFSPEDPTKVYQGDMVELFYIMTHLDGKIFSTADILNYLSYKQINYIISDNSIVEKIDITL
jgi:hypothetical protein